MININPSEIIRDDNTFFPGNARPTTVPDIIPKMPRNPKNFKG
jgi:hypothetical protein